MIDARTSWRALLALLTVVVLYLALAPHPPQAVSFGWDKLNHALAFTSLAFCTRLSWPGRGRRLLVAALGLLLFGGAIELVQTQVGRDGEWADLAADAVGIVAGCLVSAALLWVAGARSRAIAPANDPRR